MTRSWRVHCLRVEQSHVSSTRSLAGILGTELDTLAFAEQLEDGAANGAAVEEVFNARLIANEAEAFVDEQASNGSRRHTVTSDILPLASTTRKGPARLWAARHEDGCPGESARPVRALTIAPGLSEAAGAGDGNTPLSGPRRATRVGRYPARLNDRHMTPDLPDKFPAIPGIVLAAGRSLRMGRVKALLEWPGTCLTFVTHVTNSLRDAGASPIAVITGTHHDVIAPALPDFACAVFNPRHDEGQLASLQQALSWGFSEQNREWVLVTLVDVPGVAVATIRALLDATTHTKALAVRPVVGQRHGHPVLWHRDAWPLITAADPASGARVVMHALAAAGRVCDVPTHDVGVLHDVDTPQHYAALSRGAARSPDDAWAKFD